MEAGDIHPRLFNLDATAQERIIPAFITDCGLRAMTRIHHGFIWQHHQSGVDTVHQLAVAATGKIIPANPVVEQCITGKYRSVSEQADTA